MQCSSCHTVLPFIYPSICQTTQTSSRLILWLLVKLNYVPKVVCGPNESFLPLCMRMQYNFIVPPIRRYHFFSPTHQIWTGLATCFNFIKMSRCDIIQLQSLDLKRPCSFISPRLVALRLLYKAVWVSHLKDEKPCGRETRYLSQQPWSTARHVHEAK